MQYKIEPNFDLHLA